MKGWLHVADWGASKIMGRNRMQCDVGMVDRLRVDLSTLGYIGPRGHMLHQGSPMWRSAALLPYYHSTRISHSWARYLNSQASQETMWRTSVHKNSTSDTCWSDIFDLKTQCHPSVDNISSEERSNPCWNFHLMRGWTGRGLRRNSVDLSPNDFYWRHIPRAVPQSYALDGSSWSSASTEMGRQTWIVLCVQSNPMIISKGYHWKPSSNALLL